MSRTFRVWSVVVSMLVLGTAPCALAHDVDLGGVVVSVSDSWTAQLFHVVDQMSEWDEACHRQYGRWAARELRLDQRDRSLLDEHAEMRRKRGWNQGFEQAFYVEDSVESAAEKAVASQLLTDAEAFAEKQILLHFAPKLVVLRERGASRIASLTKRIDREALKIRPTVRRLLRFAEAKAGVRLMLFLVPNPEEGNAGGAFNGGRLVLEVQDEPDPLPTLLHECLHALLWQHEARVALAAKEAGLSFGGLNEGIAYAFAPGIVDPLEEADSLGEMIVRGVLRGTPASNSYMQAYAVAIVIRPLVRAALERGETLTTFLPRAVEKWRAARR